MVRLFSYVLAGCLFAVSAQAQTAKATLKDAAGKEVERHIGFWEKDAFVAALTKAGLR